MTERTKELLDNITYSFSEYAGIFLAILPLFVGLAGLLVITLLVIKIIV